MSYDNNGLQSGKKTRAGRRKFLKGISAGALVATAGCTGGSDDGGDGSGDGGDGGGTMNGNGDPKPPWTTEELRDRAEEEGGEFTMYFAGPEEDVGNLVDAIAEEFDAPWLDLNPVSGDGEAIGQRLVQEVSQGQFAADCGFNMEPPIQQTDFAEEYLLRDIEEKYVSLEPLVDTPLVTDYRMEAHGGAINYGMVYHEEHMEDFGFDPASLHENSWNAFVETDEYSDMPAIMQLDPSWPQMGSAIEVHAELAGMDEEEWTRELVDSYGEFIAATSHSGGVREVIAGEAPIYTTTYVKYPYRWPEEPLDAVMPRKEFRTFGYQGYFTLKDAPNKWAARFFMSAAVEPEIQNWMTDNSVWEYNPVLHLGDSGFELDTSGMDDLQRRTLGLEDAEMELVGAEKGRQLEQKARDILIPIYEEKGYL